MSQSIAASTPVRPITLADLRRATRHLLQNGQWDQAGAYCYWSTEARGARVEAIREVQKLIPANAIEVQWFEHGPAQGEVIATVAAKWLQPRTA